VSGSPVRLADVAELAGVSIATASRVLNGSARLVGEPYRERVVTAARQLRYTPNAPAQAVARGASNTVGLLVHDIADPYFSTIASGVAGVAEQRGLVVVLANTRRDARVEGAYVAMLASQRARALIIAGSRFAGRAENAALAAEVERFTGIGGRVSCIGQDRLGTSTVVPQNAAGARALGHALFDLGHRRFVVLAGPPELLTARDRLRGFRSGLADRGIPAERVRVVHGAFTRDGGHAAASQLAAERRGETCVFAVNDVMAVGAIAAFREARVNVPGDVSVAGFDDIATLRDLVPPLTTVRLPLEEMGATAAAMALDDRGTRTKRVVTVRGEVVLRESTRRLTRPRRSAASPP
jgi:LacI family transcriptional regulator